MEQNDCKLAQEWVSLMQQKSWWSTATEAVFQPQPHLHQLHSYYALEFIHNLLIFGYETETKDLKNLIIENKFGLQSDDWKEKTTVNFLQKIFVVHEPKASDSQSEVSKKTTTNAERNDWIMNVGLPESVAQGSDEMINFLFKKLIKKKLQKKEGDIVRSNVDGKWRRHRNVDLKYSGEIKRVNRDGTYDILYENGVRKGVKEHQLEGSTENIQSTNEQFNTVQYLVKNYTNQQILAKRAMQAADNALNCLSKENVRELTSLKKQPPGLDKLITTMLILVKGEIHSFKHDIWNSFQLMMWQLQTYIKEFDATNISQEVLDELGPMMSGIYELAYDTNQKNEEFIHELAYTEAVVNLSKWIVSTLNYNKICTKVVKLLLKLCSTNKMKNNGININNHAAVRFLLQDMSKEVAVNKLNARDNEGNTSMHCLLLSKLNNSNKSSLEEFDIFLTLSELVPRNHEIWSEVYNNDGHSILYLAGFTLPRYRGTVCLHHLAEAWKPVVHAKNIKERKVSMENLFSSFSLVALANDGIMEENEQSLAIFSNLVEIAGSLFVGEKSSPLSELSHPITGENLLHSILRLFHKKEKERQKKDEEVNALLHFTNALGTQSTKCNYTDDEEKGGEGEKGERKLLTAEENEDNNSVSGTTNIYNYSNQGNTQSEWDNKKRNLLQLLLLSIPWDSRDNKMNTSLHVAAKLDDVVAVIFLLKMKAVYSQSKANLDSQTALDVAGPKTKQIMLDDKENKKKERFSQLTMQQSPLPEDRLSKEAQLSLPIKILNQLSTGTNLYSVLQSLDLNTMEKKEDTKKDGLQSMESAKQEAAAAVVAAAAADAQLPSIVERLKLSTFDSANPVIFYKHLSMIYKLDDGRREACLQIVECLARGRTKYLTKAKNYMSTTECTDHERQAIYEQAERKHQSKLQLYRTSFGFNTEHALDVIWEKNYSYSSRRRTTCTVYRVWGIFSDDSYMDSSNQEHQVLIQKCIQKAIDSYIRSTEAVPDDSSSTLPSAEVNPDGTLGLTPWILADGTRCLSDNQIEIVERIPTAPLILVGPGE